jgi:sulfatase maturation enzyme AslB (radical SAM superfamily)
VHGTHPAHPKIDGSESLVDIYQKSPTFLRVRDYAQIKGKCGVCEFKFICGGSRARAYALTGDPMRSDPYCIYQPARLEDAAFGDGLASRRRRSGRLHVKIDRAKCITGEEK